MARKANKGEIGVRYVTIRVRAKRHIPSFHNEVARALMDHRIPVSYSPALFPAFEDVEVVDVQYGYQYELGVKGGM